MLINLVKSPYYNWRRKRQRIEKLDHVSKPTFIHIDASFKFHQNIKIGRYCRIGKFCNLDGEGGLEIGDGTVLAPYVTLLSSSHNYDQVSMLPYDSADQCGSIKIGKGCWLGWGAMVSPGVSIGDGSVVGMGAVVTKDVAPGHIVVGNPAKSIKQRDLSFVEKAIEEENFYLRFSHQNQLTRKGRGPGENRRFWII